MTPWTRVAARSFSVGVEISDRRGGGSPESKYASKTTKLFGCSAKVARPKYLRARARLDQTHGRRVLSRCRRRGRVAAPPRGATWIFRGRVIR